MIRFRFLNWSGSSKAVHCYGRNIKVVLSCKGKCIGCVIRKHFMHEILTHCDSFQCMHRSFKKTTNTLINIKHLNTITTFIITVQFIYNLKILYIKFCVTSYKSGKIVIPQNAKCTGTKKVAVNAHQYASLLNSIL